MINAGLDLSCSMRTIDRVLISADLHKRVAKSYPYSESEKASRLAFANYILEQEDEFFDRILQLVPSTMHINCIHVRRTTGETVHFADTYTWKDENKKRSGTSKFFAGFSSHGVGKLHYYAKIDGKVMKCIVADNIIRGMRRLFPSGPAYTLHGNDKRWRCREVENFVHNKGITQIDDRCIHRNLIL
jgi:hypothetical protein